VELALTVVGGTEGKKKGQAEVRRDRGTTKTLGKPPSGGQTS